MNPSPAPQHRLRSAAAVLLLLSPALAGAQTLLNDTFTDGGRTNGADAQDTAWFGGNSNSVFPSVVNNAVVLDLGANGANTAFSGGFTRTTLTVGQTLTLSFTVKFDRTTGAVNQADGFRFGLLDSQNVPTTADSSLVNGSDAAYNAWKGYSTWIGLGLSSGTSASSIRERTGTGTTLMGGGANTALGGSTSLNNLVVNEAGGIVSYDLSFSITSTVAGLDLVYKVNGSDTLTRTDLTPSTVTFDEIGFLGVGPSLQTGTYTLDNLSVILSSPIPEPSTYAALTGAAGLLAALAVRRRRSAR